MHTHEQRKEWTKYPLPQIHISTEKNQYNRQSPPQIQQTHPCASTSTPSNPALFANPAAFRNTYNWPQNANATGPDHQQQQQNFYPQQHQQQQSFPTYIGPSTTATTNFLEPGCPYPTQGAFESQPVADQYMQQFWELDGNAWNNGLTETQQQELMRSLETDGMEDIQGMITSTTAMHQAMMQGYQSKEQQQ
jgi:hypothetical protein